MNFSCECNLPPGPEGNPQAARQPPGRKATPGPQGNPWAARQPPKGTSLIVS